MGEMVWDPELRLSLGRSVDAQSDSSGRSSCVEEAPFSATSARQPQQKQITMFYDGQICVCDVTEIQARSIISMAKREMDAKVEKTSRQQQQQQPVQWSSSPSSPAALQQQLLNPSGLSMKRSLQRFLEKRKTRADAVSPYSHERPFYSFLIKS